MIYKIAPENPDEGLIQKAADIIKKGGVVVLPTETRYGLCADINNPNAIDLLYGLKMRPATMPSAIFLKNCAIIGEWAHETDLSKKLAATLLPGPLTLVLDNKSKFSKPIVEQGKIGIRVSSSPVIANIIKCLNYPITATSANISGEQDCETIDHIFKIFGNKINLYLDSGRLNSLTSTVVECCNDKIKILRSGAISDTEINSAIG